MKLVKNKKTVFTVLIIGTIFIAFGINRIREVQKSHQTFENYYAFRGCVELLQKNPNFGICKINTGQIIKIVKYQDKWYLDENLPCGSLFCW